MRRSIRWELPLSYIAIALLAMAALAVVLLLILRSHYGRLELAYLEGNARAFSYALGPLLDDDPDAASLQAQVVSLSFLSQARVRLLDEGGALLADSAPPGRFNVAVAAMGEVDRPLALPGRVDPGGSPMIAILPHPLDSEVFSSTETLLPRLLFVPESSGDFPGPPTFRFPPDSLEYPLFLGRVDESGSRSDLIVRQPIYSVASELLGYVEMSEGPAYEQDVIANVARGAAGAGAIAAVLAAVVGWLVSRRISAPLLALTGATTRMAAGDLTARAGVRRRDEFGTLAWSFNAMADQVEDTVLTLRRFVSDAAHELHTPLATLRANLEMLRQDSPSAEAERVALAQAQAERLEVLIGGLLDLSRIEAGPRQNAFEPVSLTALVQEMGEMAASRAEHTGVEFELSLPEAPVTVRGDELHLHQALGNLLDNAVKFTPAGGRVALGLRQEGDLATLWVEDTGIGVLEEDLPYLFQRFHRGRNTAGYPGSGLGLAIVRAIAEEHGGQVSVETTGRGSRFSLQLPAAGSRT